MHTTMGNIFSDAINNRGEGAKTAMPIGSVKQSRASDTSDKVRVRCVLPGNNNNEGCTAMMAVNGFLM
jgi:hypothetical protein